MMDEIKSIEKNNTWSLVELPKGAKTVGVKYGIDYLEVYAPVARMETVRTIIALAAQQRWNIYQLDVKSAFLHGKLDEDVYVEQPQGFEVKGSEKKAVKTPIARGTELNKDKSEVAVSESYYKQIVGCLMYLTDTRLDIMYAASLVSSNGVVSWLSKKQPIVTLSTTEAEFLAAAGCSTQAIWLKRVLEKIGYESKGGVTVYCDNNSTIKLSKNPVMHGRSKHIDVRFHFLRDLVQSGNT
nr:hypothetical protein [Tanacetum cinerariifolium]